jgi:hypothetical protein
MSVLEHDLHLYIQDTHHCSVVQFVCAWPKLKLIGFSIYSMNLHHFLLQFRLYVWSTFVCGHNGSIMFACRRLVPQFSKMSLLLCLVLWFVMLVSLSAVQRCLTAHVISVFIQRKGCIRKFCYPCIHSCIGLVRRCAVLLLLYYINILTSALAQTVQII